MAETAIAAPARFSAFRAGFRAMLPLWLGAIPFAFAYTLAGQKSELSGLEIGVMSVLLGSATIQLSLVNFLATASPLWLVLLTAFSLSVQLILYGMVLQQKYKFSKGERLLMGGFLTDAAYALTLAGEKPGYFLLGAEVSMYAVWNLGTFGGILLQGIIPNLGGQGLEFIIPLTFLVVLVPMVRGRTALLIVAVAAVTALVGRLVLPSGLNILATAAVSGLAGMILTPAQSSKV